MTNDAVSGYNAARLSAALIQMERALGSLSHHSGDLPEAVWGPLQDAGPDNFSPNYDLEKLREVATRKSAGLRIIEGAEWRVFYDDYDKGTLFVGHVSKSGGIDHQADGIREGAVAEFIATFNPRTVNALLDEIERLRHVVLGLQRQVLA